MLRRRQINADPKGRLARLLLGLADVVRWPFERLAWLFERHLLWPVGEAVAGRSVPGRAVGATALAGVAVGALVTGLILLPGGDSSPRQTERAVPAATAATPVAPAPAPEPAEPALRGVAPSFGTDAASGGDSPVSDAGGSAAEVPAGEFNAGAEAVPSADPAAAKMSSGPKPVPAGPVAMKIARRFSEAFVYYEIGERPGRAKVVFEETASPQLASALSERPPRQPQSTGVPKARVVNLVAGPRSGKAYTVSASLLRVGAISELRLELRKQQGEWRVTDVRG